MSQPLQEWYSVTRHIVSVHVMQDYRMGRLKLRLSLQDRIDRQLNRTTPIKVRRKRNKLQFGSLRSLHARTVTLFEL